MEPLALYGPMIGLMLTGATIGFPLGMRFMWRWCEHDRKISEWRKEALLHASKEICAHRRRLNDWEKYPKYPEHGDIYREMIDETSPYKGKDYASFRAAYD